MKLQPVTVETDSENDPKAHFGKLFLKGESFGLNSFKRRKFRFGHIIIQFVRFYLGS